MSTVQVSRIDGTCYEIDINLSCTVAELKEKIKAEAGGLDVDRQILIYEDEELEDGRTLESYEILVQDTISLTVALPGIDIQVTLANHEIRRWHFDKGGATPISALLKKVADEGVTNICVKHKDRVLSADSNSKTFKECGIRRGDMIVVTGSLPGGGFKLNLKQFQ